MKALCYDCGCHFDDEFEDTLKCTFWKRKRLHRIAKKYKKQIWDWFFSFPHDEFAIITKHLLVTSWYGAATKYKGNEFCEVFPSYEQLSDKERRDLQRQYFLNRRDEIMGAPAQTYFCENGHIVTDVPHHYIIDDKGLQCSYCDSKNIRCVLEWHDPDYWEDENCDAVVSHNPVDTELHSISVPVYDVKKLFEEAK
jgi:hypothetical protein